MNDTDTTTTTCANCGRGEESTGDLRACTACKLVKYCNRECQIAHRPLHKKACKKRAAELHDEALFREHLPREDCPICFLPLPLDASEIEFQSCCGKIICFGCTVSIIKEAGELGICAFCREPDTWEDADEVERLRKLMDANNARAFYNLAGYYERGDGVPQDMAKAIELQLRAGELGCADSYYNLGISYDNGDGVEMNKKKGKHFYELAAMNGSVNARYNLGCVEMEAGNHSRACKHFILAANAGSKDSLDWVKDVFMEGLVTKDQYENSLRAYHSQHNEMKSDQRDRASEILQDYERNDQGASW